MRGGGGFGNSGGGFGSGFGSSFGTTLGGRGGGRGGGGFGGSDMSFSSFRDDGGNSGGGGGGMGRGGGMAFNGDSFDGGMPGFSGFNESYLVKMRGLPWSANLSDIKEFFAGTAKVIDAELNYGMDGRPSGAADVIFGSMDDAKAAMTKHRSNMGSRYVELFFEGPI